MLRGGEHGHIHSDFRNDADCGKGLDTRHRHNKFELRKILLSGRQNQRFQIELAQFQAIHVGKYDAELFSLFSTHLSVHSGKYLFVRCFHAIGTETRNIRDFFSWVFQNPSGNSRGCLAKPKHIREHIVQFEVGNSKAVLCPVFSPIVKLVSFQRSRTKSRSWRISVGRIKLPATRSCLKMSAIPWRLACQFSFPESLSHTWGEPE